MSVFPLTMIGGTRQNPPSSILSSRGSCEISQKHKTGLIESVRLPRCAPNPFMKRALVSQRLPQFEAVAVTVLDPGEAAIAGVLALGIDPDSGRGKLCEQSIEVVDAV